MNNNELPSGEIVGFVALEFSVRKVSGVEKQAAIRRSRAAVTRRCKFQREAIDDDEVTLTVLTTKGTRELNLQAHRCAIHGRCLPEYNCYKQATSEQIVKGEWAQPCANCQEKELVLLNPEP